MRKLFVTAEGFLLDSFRLARKIWDSGYVPNFIIGIWRGGTPAAIAVHEFFRFKGHDPYHTAIKTQCYGRTHEPGKVEVKGIEHVVDIIRHDDRLLLVDDVFDSGVTMKEVLRIVREKARRNTPEIRIATVYYKPRRSRVDLKPDFYMHEVDEWLVFPHELDGLTEYEIKKKGLRVHKAVFG